VTSRLGTGKSLTFFHSVDTSLRRNLILFELDTGYREGGDLYIYTLQSTYSITFDYSWIIGPVSAERNTLFKWGIFDSERGGRPFIQYDLHRLFSFNLSLTHRLNMELDIQSLFGLLCTAVLIG
jgi:hypothetical protein